MPDEPDEPDTTDVTRYLERWGSSLRKASSSAPVPPERSDHPEDGHDSKGFVVFPAQFEGALLGREEIGEHGKNCAQGNSNERANDDVSDNEMNLGLEKLLEHVPIVSGRK